MAALRVDNNSRRLRSGTKKWTEITRLDVELKEERKALSDKAAKGMVDVRSKRQHPNRRRKAFIVATPLKTMLPFLPMEIVESIAWRLEDDVLALRRSCRELQSKTWSMFKERYFSLRQIWIDRSALKTLLKLSQHEELSAAVKTIVITLHHFSPRGTEQKLLSMDDNAGTKLRNAVNDQRMLRIGGYAAASLSTIFGRLKSLKHLEIGYGRTELKPAKGAKVEWQWVHNFCLSNGMTKYGASIGAYPMSWVRQDETEQIITSTWMIALNAVSNSRIQLETMKFTANSLPPDAFALCSTPVLERLKHSCTSNTRELQLRIQAPTKPSDQLGWDDAFPNFLGIFENLTSLDLDFPSGPSSSRVLFIAMQKMPRFHILRHLSLVGACTKPTQLLKWLSILEKLEELELRGVDLTSDLDNDAPDASTSLWDIFLINLSKGLKLKKLTLCALTQDEDPVGFDMEGTGHPWHILPKVIFEGADFAKDLANAIEHLMLVEYDSEMDDEDMLDYYGVDDEDEYDSEFDFEYGMGHMCDSHHHHHHHHHHTLEDMGLI